MVLIAFPPRAWNQRKMDTVWIWWIMSTIWCQTDPYNRAQSKYIITIGRLFHDCIYMHFSNQVTKRNQGTSLHGLENPGYWKSAFMEKMSNLISPLTPAFSEACFIDFVSEICIETEDPALWLFFVCFCVCVFCSFSQFLGGLDLKMSWHRLV